MNKTSTNDRAFVRFHVSLILGLTLTVFALTLTNNAQATTVTFNGSGSWTAPAGVTSVMVEAWGGGGAGGGATSNPGKGGGGAGGQYASQVLTVTPGNSYTVVVGAGGSGTTASGTVGGDSSFATNAVIAKGGAGGAAATATNGTAGLGSISGGFGTTVFAGGDGSAGLGSAGTGGAGGGGAGSSGAGGAASGNIAGAGTANGGGAGANAITSGGACTNAAFPAGGGGCGGYATGKNDRSGGNGAVGKVNISFFPPTATTIAATSVTATGATLNGTVTSNGASTTVTFDYGPTAAYGGSASAPQSPLLAGASGTAVTAGLTGLACSTLYHFRVNGANSGGITNGADLTFTTSSCLAVTSINRASTNPTAPATAIAWTVVFNRSVTGVDVTDFVLVTTGGISGAAITSVTGAGTTWTVNATTGMYGGTIGLNLVDDDTIIDSGGMKLGGDGLANGNFTGQVYTDTAPFCSPPADTPTGLAVSCVCDTFVRATLNPSTIFNSNWVVSTSDLTGIVPSIVNSGYLRLTDNTGDNAKAATVPGIFPAAGNYISVEFQQYAYNGSGADGIAVTLSDYAVPAVPGAFGGSLGYAQKTGTACNTTSCPGFAGGWIGVALDEFGNFQNPTEGRIGGPGPVAESVAMRGSGSGVNGYQYLAGTAALSPLIDNRASALASPGNYYQVIVDARNEPTSTAVAVNRDTGSGYVPLINIPNVYSAATTQGFTQSPVPANWQISFTGSTGGSTNIHEIGGLRICAQVIAPPSGGTAGSFNAVDESYGNASVSPGVAIGNYLQGHIFAKLAGTSFKLNVAALNNSQILTTYAAGGAKTVTVKLVNNDGTDGIADCTLSCTAACKAKTAVTDTTATQTLTFTSGATDKGQKQSGGFMLNKAWKNLVAIIDDGATTACSTDSFSVRPLSFTVSATTGGATPSTLATAGSGANSAPIVKAGANFTINANSGILGYSGTPLIDNSKAKDYLSNATPLTMLSGAFNPANAASGNSSGANFKYSDVGYFVFNADSVYDSAWTNVDQGSKGDCIANSSSNGIDISATTNKGKYGCNVGMVSDPLNPFSGGRFIPDHFGVTGSPSILNRADMGCAAAATSTYMGEPMKVSFTLNALNSAGVVTPNYAGAYAKVAASTNVSWLAYGSSDSLGLWMNATNYTLNGSTCKVRFLNGTTTTFGSCSGAVPATVNRAAGSRVTVVAGTPTTPSWSAGASDFAANVILERADTPDGSYGTLNIGIAPQDTDGVTLSSFDLDTDNDGVNERTSVATTDLRYGRLSIPNIYGSELLALPINVLAQYWSGASFLTNPTDSCTSLVGGNFTKSAGPGGVINTTVIGGGVMAVGAGRITLTVPTGFTTKGSVDLNSNISYLPGVGRETFGIYKAGPIIYLREVY